MVVCLGKGAKQGNPLAESGKIELKNNYCSLSTGQFVNNYCSQSPLKVSEKPPRDVTPFYQAAHLIGADTCKTGEDGSHHLSTL